MGTRIAAGRLVVGIFCLIAHLFVVASPATAAGYASNENFTVFTESLATRELSNQYARDILERAERFRTQIAREWLGEELPPGIGQTTISVRFGDQDQGSSWPVDDPRRQFHTIYLTATPDGIPDDVLAHEIAHIVLATRFPHPHRLPAWIDEGIASRYDDSERQQTRTQILDWMARTGNFPRLSTALESESIRAHDRVRYAVSCSVTEYLLTQGDRQQFLAFGDTATRHGWPSALRQHYGLASVDALEQGWHEWMKARTK